METSKRLVLVVLCASALWGAGAAQAAGRCTEIRSIVETLVDAWRTTCDESAGRAPGSRQYTLMSTAPIWGQPSMRDPWLIVAVAAVSQSVGSKWGPDDMIVLTDASEVRAGRVYGVPVSFAVQLQAKLKMGEIEPQAAANSIVRTWRTTGAARK